MLSYHKLEKIYAVSKHHTRKHAHQAYKCYYAIAKKRLSMTMIHQFQSPHIPCKFDLSKFIITMLFTKIFSLFIVSLCITSGFCNTNQLTFPRSHKQKKKTNEQTYFQNDSLHLCSPYIIGKRINAHAQFFFLSNKDKYIYFCRQVNLLSSHVKIFQ